MKRVLPLIAGAVIAGTTVGCTGPFTLTKKVHTFQTSFEDKWMDEVAFLGCWIFPVYELAMLADGLILNSIEFWTGDSPADTVYLDKDGNKAQMTLRADNKIEIKSGDKTVLLEKTIDGIIATDSAGTLLYRAKKGTDQAIRVYDANNTLIKSSQI